MSALFAIMVVLGRLYIPETVSCRPEVGIIGCLFAFLAFPKVAIRVQSILNGPSRKLKHYVFVMIAPLPRRLPTVG